ncbi:MAG: hypothetical protein H0U20_08400 [Thermoleophilaceae bacterium]|nr:hypothetical protein [Thermoleophilaceae bacterium]
MPFETREAMLDAVQRNSIIVGAYTGPGGGICPMLAAHRNGGRTSFAGFARAWDRYTGAVEGARPASERELRALTTMLESSIALEASSGEGALGEAIADHRDAQLDRAVREEHDAPAPRFSDAMEEMERAESYRASPGRMNCISGTMHAGEVRSR